MTRSNSRHDKPATAKPKTLAQQNTDFTAEGSPPPGQVAGVATATPGRRPPAAARRSRTARP